MTDIVAAWTDQGWCDACKTNIEAHPHEPGCPIAEIERLRAALREIVEYDAVYGIRDDGDGHSLVSIARAAIEKP